MAAGLTIRKNNFAAFAEKFRQIAREMLSDDLLQPRLQIDHELTFSELNLDLLDWHERCNRLGAAIVQPVICCARSRTRRAADRFCMINISFCDCGSADVSACDFFRRRRGTASTRSVGRRISNRAGRVRRHHTFAIARPGSARGCSIGMIDLAQPLADLDWVPRAKLTPLRRLEIETVEDLLTHFPRRHEDRREFPALSSRRINAGNLSVRRSGEDAAAAIRGLEENF